MQDVDSKPFDELAAGFDVYQNQGDGITGNGVYDLMEDVLPLGETHDLRSQWGTNWSEEVYDSVSCAVTLRMPLTYIRPDVTAPPCHFYPLCTACQYGPTTVDNADPSVNQCSVFSPRSRRNCWRLSTLHYSLRELAKYLRTYE
jgi:hypothetical protein